MDSAPQLQVVKDNLAQNTATVSEKDCLQKLTQFKMKRDNVKKSIKLLERQQDENLKYLTDHGITSVADAKDSAEATITLNNFKTIRSTIVKRNDEITLLNDTISRLDGMIKKIRQENMERSSALTEDQMIELIAIQKELDDKLGLTESNLFDDAEIDAMLNAARKEEQEKSDQNYWNVATNCF